MSTLIPWKCCQTTRPKSSVLSSWRGWSDNYTIYGFVEEERYKHRTVNHSRDEYVRGDIHVNTDEGIRSALAPLLAHFRGLSKRFLHLPVARFEFLHNHGHLKPLERAITAL